MHPVQPSARGLTPVLAFARNRIFRLVYGLSLTKGRPEDCGEPCHRLKSITRPDLSSDLHSPFFHLPRPASFYPKFVEARRCNSVCEERRWGIRSGDEKLGNVAGKCRMSGSLTVKLVQMCKGSSNQVENIARIGGKRLMWKVDCFAFKYMLDQGWATRGPLKILHFDFQKFHIFPGF